jgi:hypothetical protein
MPIPAIGRDTIGTEAHEFQSVRDHLVPGSIPEQFFDIGYWLNVQIVHAATDNTAHVVVVCHVPVETLLGTRHIQLLSQSFSTKNFEVAVHGGHADIWHIQPYHPVQLVCCWMRTQIPELIQNCFPLFAFPANRRGSILSVTTSFNNY